MMIVNPHEVIPISFNMYKTLYENYYSIEMETRPIFCSNKITDKSNRDNVTRSSWCKENVRHECTTRKAKVSDTLKTDR